MNFKVKTIQDVAKAAGVSTATVSRALSQPKMVSESTRETVMEAVRATGYRVNQAARNLRKRRASAVLVLVPNLGNPFFSQILSGLSEGFADSEYSVLILDTNNIPSDHKGLVDYFTDSRIEGMVTLDGSLSLDTLDHFAESGVSDRIVCACEWIADSDLPSVRSDNFKGAQLAVRHLFELGHRRIAHITGPADNVLTKERRDAVLQARAELNLPTRPEWIIRGDFSLESGRDAAKQISTLTGHDRPSAVFCASDEMAIGLISGLNAAGIKVPQDISVVGFDDIESAEFLIPSLTTIRQDRLSIGRKAAGLLIGHLNGDKSANKDGIETVDVELIQRESTQAVQ